jgi:hypothetical protein
MPENPGIEFAGGEDESYFATLEMQVSSPAAVSAA